MEMQTFTLFLWGGGENNPDYLIIIISAYSQAYEPVDQLQMKK